MARSIHTRCAVPNGAYRGRKFYRIPVVVTFGERAATLQENDYPTIELEVIARTAAEAANLVIDELAATPCVDVEAFGPQGGIAHRYHGWDTAIWHQMISAEREARQLRLI